MIKFCVLGSGSKGNAIFVSVDGYDMLFDAGFKKKELERRLLSIGRTLKGIDAVFYSHAHSDHYLPGVVDEKKVVQSPIPRFYFCGPAIIGAFPLSHDEPCLGFTVEDHYGNKIAILSDTGYVAEEAIAELFDCQAILIECSYDIDLLINSPYSTELQERIASTTGHLRNECAAEVVGMANWPGLKYVVALHLSQTNNNSLFVDGCIRGALQGNDDCSVIISSQGAAGRIITVI